MKPRMKENLPEANSIISSTKEDMTDEVWCQDHVDCFLQTLMGWFTMSLFLESRVWIMNTTKQSCNTSVILCETHFWEVVHQQRKICIIKKDNFPCSHVCHHKQIFLVKQHSILPHLPYSLDPTPCDSLFAHLKKTMKSNQFNEVEEIRVNTMRQMNTITKNAYQMCFCQWQNIGTLSHSHNTNSVT